MTLIHPVVDLVLGVVAGAAITLEATQRWWMVPIVIRRLFS
jgi:hypothetical protein